MKKTLFWISGASFVLAAIVAVIAINAPGTAVAQDGQSQPQAAAEPVSFKDDAATAADTFTDLAEDLLDQLVADGVITAAEADEFRTQLAEARKEFDSTDWDAAEDDLRNGITRLKRLVSLANWDEVQAMIEQGLAELDLESIELPDLSGVEGLEDFDLDGLELPEIDLDSVDWSGLEQLFDQLKQGITAFDFDAAISEFKKELSEVDWDDVAADIRDELKGVDFTEYKDWERHDWSEDLDLEGLEDKINGIDWNALREQLQDRLKDLDL